MSGLAALVTVYPYSLEMKPGRERNRRRAHPVYGNWRFITKKH
ncbi:hypothetical protein GSUET_28430 [Geobacter sulfurreducens subsp. ethanolicus]|nr:hypothetical protein GSUET_28430 [Geobacter sulfurreducens subsp. ethanolicus]